MRKKSKTVLYTGVYLALGMGALALSAPRASALQCGWEARVTDLMNCSCNNARGMVQDFSWSNGNHMLIVNLVAGVGGSFIEGIGWPGANGGTFLRDFGANDGSQSELQPVNYEFIGCAVNDGAIVVE